MDTLVGPHQTILHALDHNLDILHPTLVGFLWRYLQLHLLAFVAVRLGPGDGTVACKCEWNRSRPNLVANNPCGLPIFCFFAAALVPPH